MKGQKEKEKEEWEGVGEEVEEGGVMEKKWEREGERKRPQGG